MQFFKAFFDNERYLVDLIIYYLLSIYLNARQEFCTSFVQVLYNFGTFILCTVISFAEADNEIVHHNPHPLILNQILTTLY